jgi:hypothetical protein
MGMSFLFIEYVTIYINVTLCNVYRSWYMRIFLSKPEKITTVFI